MPPRIATRCWTTEKVRSIVDQAGKIAIIDGEAMKKDGGHG
jgi:hypothetical protein